MDNKVDGPQGQETWKNTSKGRVVVWKQDSRGDYKDVLVASDQKFVLSREDRIFNMDQAANKELDNFSNGTLAPVRLLDSTDDAKEFAANPNLISESDVRALFKGHWKTFEAKVNAMTNATTLNRLLAVAEEEDASMRQVKVIKARLEEIDPSSYVEVTSTPLSGQSAGSDRPSTRGGVTPR